jgi:hypothetical protein
VIGGQGTEPRREFGSTHVAQLARVYMSGQPETAGGREKLPGFRDTEGNVLAKGIHRIDETLASQRCKP